MVIGPIPAIRPVTMIRPLSAATDLSRIMETENRGQSGDDEYTPSDRKPARGLEDEEQEEPMEESVDAAPRPESSGTVSFFA